jgi:hypothetical protein
MGKLFFVPTFTPRIRRAYRFAIQSSALLARLRQKLLAFLRVVGVAVWEGILVKAAGLPQPGTLRSVDKATPTSRSGVAWNGRIAGVRAPFVVATRIAFNQGLIVKEQARPGITIQSVCWAIGGCVFHRTSPASRKGKHKSQYVEAHFGRPTGILSA